MPRRRKSSAKPTTSRSDASTEPAAAPAAPPQPAAPTTPVAASASAGTPPASPPGGGMGQGVTPPAPPKGRFSPAMIVIAAVVGIALLGGGGLLAAKLLKKEPTQAVSGEDLLRASSGQQGGSQTEDPDPGEPEPDEPEPDEPEEPEEPAQTGGAGSSVTLEGGIGVTPADGWEVGEQKARGVLLQTEGAILLLNTYDVGADTTAEALAATYIRETLQENYPGLQAAGEAVDPPDNTISAHRFDFLATASCHHGNHGIEGKVFGFVRSDGTGIVLEIRNAEGEMDTYVDDYMAMLASVLNTI